MSDTDEERLRLRSWHVKITTLLGDVVFDDDVEAATSTAAVMFAFGSVPSDDMPAWKASEFYRVQVDRRES